MHQFKQLSHTLLLFATLLITLPAVASQPVDVENRPVRDIKLEGIKQVDQQIILNVISMKPGSPYDSDKVASDIRTITRLNRFSKVEAKIKVNPDNTIDLTYAVTESMLLADVQVTGNKNLGDNELLGLILLGPGDPIDPFHIQNAREKIQDHYEKSGYFLAEVSVDEQALNEDNILIFKIREGPKPKIRDIKFSGNEIFTDDQLKTKINSNTYVFIFRKGELYDEQLTKDITALRDFYLERGYRDVRIGRQIQLSDNQKDATLIFHINEGMQFTVNNITVEGNSYISQDQILQAIPMKVGKIYSVDNETKSEKAVKDLYGKLGYLDTRVTVTPFQPLGKASPKIDVTITVVEQNRYRVGNVIIRGNETTRDKVLRRQVRRLNPDQPFDTTGIEETKQRIRGTGHFSDTRLTVLGNPDDLYRDVLIEVQERNTGRISFGAAISSDSGIFGAIDVTQTNFDIQDTPESAKELITGKAFRGAGQSFSITLQPGDEFQRYQVRFREPYIFESAYFFDASAFLYDRFRESWEEQRIGGTFGLGRRFGDVWSARGFVRVENIDIHDFELEVPTEVAALKGESDINTFGFVISRSDLDDPFLPANGSRMAFELERSGELGSDYDYTKLSLNYSIYFPVDEDFFGRKTTIRIRSEIGYIPEGADAPFFEQFYAGGRNFRGFRFRGVGPRGIRRDTMTVGDDPVGGEFMFLLGAEYSYPIYSELLRGVFFIDSGTVLDEVGLNDYRVSIGTGFRIKLPIFGQAPLAIDFGFPIQKESFDETRLISFDVALPF